MFDKKDYIIIALFIVILVAGWYVFSDLCDNRDAIDDLRKQQSAIKQKLQSARNEVSELRAINNQAREITRTIRTENTEARAINQSNNNIIRSTDEVLREVRKQVQKGD